jgi:hypothetical protein
MIKWPSKATAATFADSIFYLFTHRLSHQGDVMMVAVVVVVVVVWWVVTR